MNAQTKLQVKIALELIITENIVNVSRGLKELEKNADVSVIEILVSIVASSTNREIKKEILAFLSNVVDPLSSALLIRFIQEEKFAAIRQELLTVIWNSKLDYSRFIAEFVEIAIEGNFMIALECLTILENLKGPFEEHQLLEAQLHLREYISSDRTMEDDQKTTIISEIALFVKEQNERDDTDMLFDE